MFCNQCEQSFHGTGCVNSPGICGKDADLQSLQEILLYGLKGMAAYANHARRLGKTDEAVNAFIEEALFSTMTNVNFDKNATLDLVLECGKHNLRVMEMLDTGHVETFGKPEPTIVKEGTQSGLGILITGHDLVDLWKLLQQCEGTSVKVYTHGEMLPAHMYPKLRNHPNLAGHFGGAWQKQKKEWTQFNGPIVVTSNCILIPKQTYADRLFTTRITAVPGGKRLMTDDFSEVIAKAQTCEPLVDMSIQETTIGFHRSVLIDNAKKICDAVNTGQISHFFLIGGCDGAESGRNYFSEYAQNTPPNSFILTLGCGKFRIRDFDYGSHLGFHRLMDMGQCNDAYGAIQVALVLANALDCDINDLPLTLVISWFEQKAVAVLLTLLYLGVRGITIGPNPPPFVSKNVFKILQEKYNLKLTQGEPLKDLQAAIVR